VNAATGHVIAVLSEDVVISFHSTQSSYQNTLDINSDNTSLTNKHHNPTILKKIKP